jgi:hypothetical protein
MVIDEYSLYGAYPDKKTGIVKQHVMKDCFSFLDIYKNQTVNNQANQTNQDTSHDKDKIGP